jgi:hypothetical protein
VVARYRGTAKRLYFRGDAAFVSPETYEFLEAEGAGYTIRLPANSVLRHRIGYLLERPVGRPPHEVRRHYVNFGYQAKSWNKPRRVVAKVEWHPGELYPRVGFIVTNLARPRRACCHLLQPARHGGAGRRRQRSSLDAGKATNSSASAQSPGCFDRPLRTRRPFTVAQDARTGDPAPTTTGKPGNVGLKVGRECRDSCHHESNRDA